ncbi:CHAP domain-containing protein [Sphingobacterium luzhongxinii]|uniref:CHAP domain-containing protein n=1 Tax=Sphingobacterium luzhongxinii TaxID=2654181 RepID=UPI001F099C6C|nr:CHAP domain-containing protein [Sphingobacterium sp. xlx-73]
MATMYSLFFGLLFTVVCSDNGCGSSVLKSRPIYSARVSRSICTMVKNAAFDIFKDLKVDAQSVVLKISSDELLFPFSGKKEKPCHGLSGVEDTLSGMEDRINIIKIASAEVGVKEATGNNDGKRVEEYLRYTDLGKGYDWCASFVSWCYGQAGLSQPRNPWSPALFPKARVYWKQNKFANSHIRDFISKASIFGIYGAKAKRINHVGLVKEISNNYLISIEGNSNNRVESRRRHFHTVRALADWTS